MIFLQPNFEKNKRIVSFLKEKMTNRRIGVSDITMKLMDRKQGASLSFRQKIELAKMLDSLGVSVIETGPIVNGKRDCLLIKSLASTIKKSTLAIPIDIFSPESVDMVWNALQEAAHPRLQVSVPVSTVQMEYQCHRKPAAIIQLVAERIAQCTALCPEVEFVAEDYGRSERDFLLDVLQAAVGNGATIVTVFDTAGTLFDYECFDSTKWIRNALPQDVKLGVWCSNEMFMADSCAIAAIRAGADEIKTTPYGNETASLKRFVKILNMKADTCQAFCNVDVTKLNRVVEQIKALCEANRHKPFSNPGVLADEQEDMKLTLHDDKETVLKMTTKLGYDLSEEDGLKVYDAFMSLAAKNETVEAKELDAIVASVAFQAPSTYYLESYLINSGNLVTATCHLRLKKEDKILECVCLGDGPVDAAFQAIEKLAGTQYELDDFQIQSVTEGREAMGGAVVRLRREGKVFSGRGISTDIVEASIKAYLNAINKIVFEEEEA